MAELLKDMTKTIKTPRRWGIVRAGPPSLLAARELLAEVAAIGGDVDGIAARAGLPFCGSDLLDEARAIVPTSLNNALFARLYAECTWALDAHESIREGRSPLSKKEVDLLCYCVITCGDLRDVIARTMDFTAMLMPRMSRLTLQDSGDDVILGMHTIRSKRGASGFVSDLTGLGMFYRLFSWLIGKDIHPLRAELCYEKYLSAATVARILPCPITYGCADNQLIFPAEYLAFPVVRSARQLEGFLPHFPFDPDRDFAASVPLHRRISHIYEGALGQSQPLPRTEILAQILGISPATLRRRLADEGSSLAALKAKCRRDLAEHYLADERETLENIAHHIGFTDISSFSRAFQAWTGCTPAQWRKNRAHAIVSTRPIINGL